MSKLNTPLADPSTTTIFLHPESPFIFIAFSNNYNFLLVRYYGLLIAPAGGALMLPQ